MEKLTISQLNKIGERLRKNLESDEDLCLLDAFRLSFTPAYQQVFEYLTVQKFNPGGRESKTTLSIRAKLVRERTRLSKMQDIAGCRVVVDNVKEQNRVVDNLKGRWPNARVDDRRMRPSHGYRAVHLIAEVDGCAIEIQVRTRLQHSWATATEKLADVIHPEIKYGGGPSEIKRGLTDISRVLADYESLEGKIAYAKELIGSLGIEKEELNRRVEQAAQDEKFAVVAKEIRELGGVEMAVQKHEMEIVRMREELKSLLQKFCKEFNIDL